MTAPRPAPAVPALRPVLIAPPPKKNNNNRWPPVHSDLSRAPADECLRWVIGHPPAVDRQPPSVERQPPSVEHQPPDPAAGTLRPYAVGGRQRGGVQPSGSSAARRDVVSLQMATPAFAFDVLGSQSTAPKVPTTAAGSRQALSLGLQPPHCLAAAAVGWLATVGGVLDSVLFHSCEALDKPLTSP